MWPISLDLVLWSRTSNIWYHLLIRFFFSCYLFSGPFQTSNLFTIHWKKTQNTLIYFELESNLKTKKKNQNNPPQYNLVQYQWMMCNYIVMSIDRCPSTLTSALSFYLAVSLHVWGILINLINFAYFTLIVIFFIEQYNETSQ